MGEGAPHGDRPGREGGPGPTSPRGAPSAHGGGRGQGAPPGRLPRDGAGPQRCSPPAAEPPSHPRSALRTRQRDGETDGRAGEQTDRQPPSVSASGSLRPRKSRGLGPPSPPHPPPGGLPGTTPQRRPRPRLRRRQRPPHRKEERRVPSGSGGGARLSSSGAPTGAERRHRRLLLKKRRSGGGHRPRAGFPSVGSPRPGRAESGDRAAAAEGDKCPARAYRKCGVAGARGSPGWRKGGSGCAGRGRARGVPEPGREPASGRGGLPGVTCAARGQLP